MAEQRTRALHADGYNGDDRTLCGVAHEGSPLDGDRRPWIAAPGQIVTCSDCRMLIAYVHTVFTPNHRVRK